MQIQRLMATAILLWMSAAAVAHSEVKLGGIFGLTGPTAAAVAPHYAVWGIVPKTLGGQPYTLTSVDDQANPTEAVKAARSLLTDGKVDVLLSTSTTPVCLALSDVAAEFRVPLICAAPVVPSPKNLPWTFSVGPTVNVYLIPAVDHMKASGVKRLAFIGFADSLGDLHLRAIELLAEKTGIEIVARERYERTATSATAQALKILASKPDAIFVAGVGTPATLPHIALVQRGFKEPIYHTNAVLGREFTRIGGAQVEGAYALATPFFVSDQLPDSNPMKKIALPFLRMWEDKQGKDARTPFPGWQYDIYRILDESIPVALKRAKPGSAEFRAAVRNAIEEGEFVGSSAVYRMTKSDHTGIDARAAVLVRLSGNVWQLAPSSSR